MQWLTVRVEGIKAGQSWDVQDEDPSFRVVSDLMLRALESVPGRVCRANRCPLNHEVQCLLMMVRLWYDALYCLRAQELGQ